MSRSSRFPHIYIMRVVARAVVEPSRDIESLRGRISAFEPRESTRQALGRVYRDLEGLFESLLAESFGGG